MPRLRRLSGAELVSALLAEGFARVSQRGSHIKLARVSPKIERQVLVVPLHADLAPGTVRAIARQARRFLSPGAVASIFYL